MPGEDIPAGAFSSWLRRTRNALRNNEGVHVPCGECKACCTSSYFIHIKPGEIETPSRIPEELLFSAPGLPEGNMLLGYDENGHCPMFIDDRCSIYDHHPLTCRSYDCRIFPATGLPAGDDKGSISQRAGRWKFDFPTKKDHRLFSAVKAAATFLQNHAERFPVSFVPGNRTQQAVLAIRVYEVFLDVAGGSENAVHEDHAQKLAEAVVAIHEKFKACGNI